MMSSQNSTNKIKIKYLEKVKVVFFCVKLMKQWLDVVCGHFLIVFFEFYKYFDNKKAIGNQKHAYYPVKSKYINLLKLRYLWTLSGRKTCMMSSNPSNTTSISNFKSISLTVVEFWKRYHQKLLNRWISEVEIWTKSCLIINDFFQYR